ncbi:MAG: TIGR00300 family protein, partial [Acidimicrobiales bacterium]
MTASETVELDGHIIDSLILAKVLDLVLAAGADYRLLDVEIGRTSTDPSRARIEVRAADENRLNTLLNELQAHGANRVEVQDAELMACEQDGVFPAGFYSTTNLATTVRLAGHWVEVANPEMDCGIVASPSGAARTVPVHRVRTGDRVVVGYDGVRVAPPDRPSGVPRFEFMASEVSSEKPKALLVASVAERIRRARQAGGKLLAVCGPAVVHTGAAPALADLVRRGWVDVLFAGNGFATHDIESNVMGTSLGVSVHEGTSSEGGHANHLRVINEVRRYGSIAAAVDAGYIDGGVMYECAR